MYVRETARNLETRVEEHVDITKTLEPARHIKSNTNHIFTFKPLRTVDSFIHRRTVEAFYTAIIKTGTKQTIQNSLTELVLPNMQIAELLNKAQPSNFSSFVNFEDDSLNRKRMV